MVELKTAKTKPVNKASSAMATPKTTGAAKAKPVGKAGIAAAAPKIAGAAKRKLVGKVVHYYDKIGVAVVELKDSLKIGDSIIIESATPVEQKVTSMQIDKKPIAQAKAGQAIGVKVSKEVKRNNNVYKAA